MGDRDAKEKSPVEPNETPNLMGVTPERFIRRELVPQDNSRPHLHPFVVKAKLYIKLKGSSLRMVALA